MNRTGTCAYLLQSSLCVFGVQSCISQLIQDKAICACSSGLLKFFHYFYSCFFQDASCKRPPWTEDHFSHCSFVCREDSTWVGVGINNQIQGGRGGGALEKFGWRTVPSRPSNPDPVSDKNRSFYHLRKLISWSCFLLFHTQNQVIFKTNIMQLDTYFFEKEKNCKTTYHAPAFTFQKDTLFKMLHCK